MSCKKKKSRDLIKKRDTYLFPVENEFIVKDGLCLFDSALATGMS